MNLPTKNNNFPTIVFKSRVDDFKYTKTIDSQ